MISIGFFYDLIGRRITIFIIVFLFGVFMVLLPWTSPNIILFSIVDIMTHVLLAPQFSLPLRQDYVHKDYLGTATAFTVIGLNLGAVFGLSVILNLVKHMDFKLSFGILGSILIVWSIFSLFLVIEPPDLKKKKESRIAKNEKRVNFRQLVLKMFQTLRSDAHLAIGLILSLFTGGQIKIT